MAIWQSTTTPGKRKDIYVYEGLAIAKSCPTEIKTVHCNAAYRHARYNVECHSTSKHVSTVHHHSLSSSLARGRVSRCTRLGSHIGRTKCSWHSCKASIASSSCLQCLPMSKYPTSCTNATEACMLTLYDKLGAQGALRRDVTYFLLD